MPMKSINDVIKRWAIKYLESRMDFDLLPSPGYSTADLALLEEGLSTILHPTLKYVLSNVNLDYVDLIGLWFGPKLVTKVKELSSSDLRNRYFEDGLVVGMTDGFLIVVDNGSGKVYAVENSNLDMLEYIASNLEECICTAATLADSALMKMIDEDNGDEIGRIVSSVDKFLADNSIKNGPYFLGKDGQLVKIDSVTPGPFAWRVNGTMHEEPGNGSFFWKQLLLGWA